MSHHKFFYIEPTVRRLRRDEGEDPTHHAMGAAAATTTGGISGAGSCGDGGGSSGVDLSSLAERHHQQQQQLEQQPSYSRYPVRVTPAALRWLLYAITYSIEFHAPKSARPTRAQQQQQQLKALREGGGSGGRRTDRTGGTTATTTTAGSVMGSNNTNTNSSGSGGGGGGGLLSMSPISIGAAAGGGGGSGSSGNFALPTSVVETAAATPQRIASAVSSFFGWPTSTGSTPVPAATPTDNNSANQFSGGGVAGGSTSQRLSPGLPPSSPPLLSQQQQQQKQRRADEAALMAWQCATQAHVVPVVQQLPMLGTTRIVIRQEHSASIERAYRRALSRIDHIVRERRERNAAAAAAIANAAEYSQQHQLHRHQQQQQQQQQSAVLLPFGLRSSEVGLEVFVRLLCTESTWRGSQARALAEWAFPVVRTSSEEETVLPLAVSSPSTANSNNSYMTTTATASHGRLYADGSGAGGESSSPTSMLFVNDPTQVEDVISFISDSFYKAISLETFADYTGGELEFDVQVTEKRGGFARPRIDYGP